ncbi:MAG: hypothetical protein PHN52_03140 [candidate division Zixibacteria bacterium]|nr:hypothetical protein [candidate division Zixibacteria bacterium]
MDMYQGTGCGRWFVSGAVFVILLISFSGATVFSQAGQLEEIVVSYEVPRLAVQDLIVQYDGKTVYLPLIEVFSALGINIRADFAQKIFTGQYYKDNGYYELNLNLLKFKYRGSEMVLNRSDFHFTTTDVYLRMDLFARLFGLEMSFDFNTLSVITQLDKSYPAYQRLERDKAHRKLEKDVTVLRDVKSLKQRRDYINGAAVDWMLSASPLGVNKTHYYNFNLGGMLLGGDINVSTTGNTSSNLKDNQYNYRWHYYIGDNDYLTQVDLGNVYSTGAFSQGLEGVKLTNKPQVQRKYFQTIQISDHLGQGWEVELYINNKLADFAYTDQFGNYNFLLDIYYGASRVMLKMYGPNGEIITKEDFIKVPYNLIPKNTIEYSLTSGVAMNQQGKKGYAQADGYYGLLGNMTLGVSTDFPLQPEEGEKPRAGFDLTYQPTGDLTLNGFAAPEYQVKGDINYSRPSIVNINGSFTKFFENEFHNKAGQKFGFKLSITSPVRLMNRYLGLRYGISFDRYANMDAINMNYGFNSSLSRFNFNYIGNYKISRFTGRTVKYVNAQLLLSANIFRWLRPQFRIDYDHLENQVTSYGIYLTRRVFRTGQLSVSFRRDVYSRANLVMITFNIFNDFASFSSKLLFSERQASMSQVQKGSVRYDREDHSFRFDRSSSVGYGSAVLKPFMDDNFNGMFDEGEEYLENLKIKVKGMGGRSYRNERLLYYDRLRPYEAYVLQVDPNSLDNPLLKPVYENFSVKVNPNVVTGIDVPLVMGAEVSGYVQRRTAEGEVGIGGVKIIFLNMTTESVTEVTTFNNGDYYYLGLVPGRYRAYIEPEILEKYGYTVEPGDIDFEVIPQEGGAIIDNINFSLIPGK